MLKKDKLTKAKQSYAIKPGLGVAPTKTRPLKPTAKPAAKIGVLLPKTRNNPPELTNFLAGLQLELKAASHSHNIEISSHVAHIAAGGLEEKFEQITQESPFNLLIGLINPSHSYYQSSKLDTSQTAFIGVSLGENIPRFEEEVTSYKENSSHLSFMSLESHWLLGSFAGRQSGKRVLIATSFYDCGYDNLYAFEKGFESEGGQVVGRLISHNSITNSKLNTLGELVEQTQPDLVFAAYNGQAAREFLAAYQKFDLAAKLPLYGNNFLLAGNNLNAAFAGIHTATAWTPALDTPSNTAFCAAYFDKTGKTPDVMALLGYEAGLLATEYLKKGSFSGLAVGSPRATLEINPFGQFASQAVWLLETQRSDDSLVNVVKQQLEISPALYPSLQVIQPEAKSGWFNPYLF